MPEIGAIIQQKIRDRKRPVLMLMQKESETKMSSVCKQIRKVYILGIRIGY